MRSPRSLKEIHSLTGKLVPGLFPSDKERKENGMDPRIRRSLLEFQIISAASTFVVHAARGGRVVLVYGNIRSCYELGSSKRGRRSSVSDLLHKQRPAQCRDQIPTVG